MAPTPTDRSPEASGRVSALATRVVAGDSLTPQRDEDGPGSSWIHLTGELDLAAAPHVRDTLRQAERNTRKVVVDLRDLAFMDCAGLNVLIDAADRARLSGRPLGVVRPREEVYKVFKETRTAQLLQFVDLDSGETSEGSPG